MTEDCRLLPNNPLEPFLLLAKNAKGAAAADLIHQATAACGVHVFGELVALEAFQQLADNEWSKEWNLLNLFAYGTFKEYIEKREVLPQLSSQQRKKLRHLTIVSMACAEKCIPYSKLLDELKLESLRELEDLIIEAIYSDVLKGKLDQKQQQFHVESTIGRDITPQKINQIAKDLDSWSCQCEKTLGVLDQQIASANSTKEANQKQKKKVEQAVENLKAAILTQSNEMSSTVVDVHSQSSGPSGQPKKHSKVPKVGVRPFSTGKTK